MAQNGIPKTNIIVCNCSLSNGYHIVSKKLMKKQEEEKEKRIQKKKEKTKEILRNKRSGN